MDYSQPITILFFAIPIIYSLVIIFMCIFGIYPGNIIDLFARKLARKDHLTKIDFEKNKKYYTDILYNHSIIELIYIDEFEIDLRKEIVCTLLSLELKNKIKITGSKIEIVNEDDTNLQLSEKEIFHCIEDGKVKINNIRKFEELLQKHAITEGKENRLLCKMNKGIKETKIQKNYIKALLILIIFTLFLVKCFLSITVEYNEGKISLISAYIYTGMFIICVPIYIMYVSFSTNVFNAYKNNMKYTYERTNLGDSVNTKIEGLKKYIREYSLLDEKEKEALMLWDEYLIYSVAFNQNKKVLKNISNLIIMKDSSKLMPFSRKEMAVTVMTFILFGAVLLLKIDYSKVILSILLIVYIIYILKSKKE